MKVTVDGHEVNLPDFMIVGAAKSGTTTLYRHLAKHPEIFFPFAQKEPFYFCFGGAEPQGLDSETTQRVIWKTEDYLELFSETPDGSFSGDASTAYLYRYSDTIDNIKNIYGSEYTKLKIIILLRNPVDRAYSHYTYLVRNGHEELSFEEAIESETIAERKDHRWGFDYLEYGSYPEQVKAYLDSFPNTEVYLLDDFKEKQKLVNLITEFIGVNEFEVKENAVANPSGMPKSRFLVDQLRNNKVMKWIVNVFPESIKHRILIQRDSMMSHLLVKVPMQVETRSKLVEHYRDQIMSLEKMIGRDLSHWLN